MKYATIIICTSILTAGLVTFSLAHRYTFYPVGDGMALYRGDNFTGQAVVASAKDRTWQPIADHKDIFDQIK